MLKTKLSHHLGKSRDTSVVPCSCWQCEQLRKFLQSEETELYTFHFVHLNFCSELYGLKPMLRDHVRAAASKVPNLYCTEKSAPYATIFLQELTSCRSGGLRLVFLQKVQSDPQPGELEEVAFLSMLCSMP